MDKPFKKSHLSLVLAFRNQHLSLGGLFGAAGMQALGKSPPVLEEHEPGDFEHKSHHKPIP